jgi:hypothetical protein
MLKLTSAQARAFTLARQYVYLPAPEPLKAVRRMVAVQAQYAAAAPAAVWARCPAVEPDWVDRSLFETRILVKTWLLRSTLHILATEDLSLLVQAFGKTYEAEFIRFLSRRRGIDPASYERSNIAILEALAGGPLTRSELHDAVPRLRKIGATSWGVDVKGLAFQGQIVVAGSRRGEPVFAAIPGWLQNQPPFKGLLELESQQEVLRRYLDAFGPAAPRDFAHWAGITVRQAQTIFTTMEGELIALEVEGWKGRQYILAKDEIEISQVHESAPVILLPKFDALLVGYARPPHFVRPENYKQVYGPAGQIDAVVLVNGESAATWRIERSGKQLRFNLTPLSPGIDLHLDAVQDAFERLGAFLGSEEITLNITSLPIDTSPS